MSNYTDIKRAVELLEDAIDPSTDHDKDPWLQVEEAKDILEKEARRQESEMILR